MSSKSKDSAFMAVNQSAKALLKAGILDCCLPFPQVNRVEVIDELGRTYVRYHAVNVHISMQDDGGTLKVFIGESHEK